jgi:hypothetical protein
MSGDSPLLNIVVAPPLVLPINILDILVTFSTFQAPTFWLKNTAELNILFMSVTFKVFHPLTIPLNLQALLKQLDKFVVCITGASVAVPVRLIHPL